jgi:Ser/Thr protein kinase RdoA (MazF antagonist)
MSEDAVIPLVGGSRPGVVRIGDTLRRPSKAWTSSVHALLRHLADKAFPYSPRALGTDEEGREVLTFIHGRVATTRPWPDEVWAESTLDQVGRIIRQFHDAVRDFVAPANARWQFHNRRCGVGELICHNDVGVTNVVFGDASRVIGLIDWDCAGPGDPINEVAHAAWWFVPIVDPSLRARIGAPSEKLERARLAILTGAYGINPSLVAERVRVVVASRLEVARRGIETNDRAFVALDARGYTADLLNTLAYLDRRAKTDHLG